MIKIRGCEGQRIAVIALRPTAVSEGQPANKEACCTIAAGTAYRWQAAVQVERHER